ncbi:MAG: hypothetical protein GX896_08375 [Clostridiales bacterium]|nr:hypothetical protein [Clostridiales bacterium]
MVSETIINYYNSMTKEELVNTCLNQYIANRSLLDIIANKTKTSKKDFEVFQKMNKEIEKLKAKVKWLTITNNMLEADLAYTEEKLEALNK